MRFLPQRSSWLIAALLLTQGLRGQGLTSISPDRVAPDGSTDVTVQGSGLDGAGLEIRIGDSGLVDPRVLSERVVTGKAPPLGRDEEPGPRDVTLVSTRTGGVLDRIPGGVTYGGTSCDASPDLRLTFGAPVSGFGETLVPLVLEETGADACSGIQGWSLSLETQGNCGPHVIVDSGTVIAPQAEGGYFKDGFKTHRIIHPADNGGRRGVVSAVALTKNGSIVLPPALSPYTLLKVGVRPIELGCEPCQLAYVDGLKGPGVPLQGQPLSNVVTVGGESHFPELTSLAEFQVCGCFPSNDTAPWTQGAVGAAASDLTGAYRRRDEGEPGYEICGAAAGYASHGDSLRRLSRALSARPDGDVRTNGSLGHSITVHEVGPTGLGGIELREGSAADSPMVSIVVERNINGTYSLRSTHRFGPGVTGETGPIRVTLPVALAIERQGTVWSFLHGTQFTGNQVEIGDAAGTAMATNKRFSFAMVQASQGPEPSSARFCVGTQDTDGDGCVDCLDEDPYSSLSKAGWIPSPCCLGDRDNFTYVYQGSDSDGDGLPNCADRDDDNDGLSDANDPCPFGFAGCDQFLDCPCAPIFFVCGLQCVANFLKLHSKINPESAIVLGEFNMPFLDFYISDPTPDDGSAIPCVREILALDAGAGAGGVAAGGGAGRIEDSLVVEIWRYGRVEAENEMVSMVGEFPFDEILVGDQSAPNLIYFKPGFGGEPSVLGTSWVLGAPPGTPLPDTDGDGIPNAFDNCIEGANPDQLDLDGDLIGDACALLDEPAGGARKPSDCNQDGNLDLSDGVCLLGHLFAGRPATLPCGDGTINHASNIELLDSNADARLDLSDAVGIFTFLFSGGRAPASCVDLQCSECAPIEGCEPRCGP